jgi:hypothetical protein
MGDRDIALDDFSTLPPPRASALIGLALLAAPFVWGRDALWFRLLCETSVTL